MTPPCPQPELLFLPEGAEHLASCDACRALAEMHRQMEKDLFRIQDPLPPADFVASVMARVEASRPPRQEVRQGFAIFASALAVALGSFVVMGGSPAELGVRLARAMISLRGAFFSLSGLVESMWSQPALVLGAALFVFVATSLVQNRRRLIAASSVGRQS